MKTILFKISRCFNRKLSKLLLHFSILCILLNYQTIDIKASSNDSFIPEKYASEMDDYLKAYIADNIPKDSLWIDSETQKNCIQNSLHNNSEKTNFNDKVNSKVYTFLCKTNDEPVYYTVLDLSFTKKIKTSKYDLLELSMNDYLRPVSPGNGVLLVKDKEDENWSIKKDIYVIVNLSFASVYGDQIHTNQNYSRVIMSFSSIGNPDSMYIMPEYIINYTHQKESFLPLIIFCVIVIIASSLLMTLFYFKILKIKNITCLKRNY